MALRASNRSAIFAGPVGRCIYERDPELARQYGAELAGRISKRDRAGLEEMERTVGRCSEAMLTPESALSKGLVYAQELQELAKLFPRRQLRVIHTDDLANSAQQAMGQPRRPPTSQTTSYYSCSASHLASVAPRERREHRTAALHPHSILDACQVMNVTFRFLGLEPIDIGQQSRFCVHGKAGVMDVLSEDENDVDIASNGVGLALPTPGKAWTAGGSVKSRRRLNVGDCTNDPEGMVTTASGALHHKLEPALEARLRAYFEPANQQLYKFLGRDLGW